MRRRLMKTIAGLFMIGFLGLLMVSCHQEQAKVTAPTPEESKRIVPVGDSVSTALLKTLKAHLINAIQEGGPVHAVKFCNLQALALSDTVARTAPWKVEVKRTSFKYRNPHNAPDPLEIRALKYFEEILSRNEPLPAFYLQKVEEGKTLYYRYYKPMKVQGLCLTCHGEPNRMSSELKLTLASLYPEDKATGYREGDFRGVISVTVYPDSP